MSQRSIPPADSSRTLYAHAAIVSAALAVPLLFAGVAVLLLLHDAAVGLILVLSSISLSSIPALLLRANSRPLAPIALSCRRLHSGLRQLEQGGGFHPRDGQTPID